jgi:hypothetical protein
MNPTVSRREFCRAIARATAPSVNPADHLLADHQIHRMWILTSRAMPDVGLNAIAWGGAASIVANDIYTRAEAMALLTELWTVVQEAGVERDRAQDRVEEQLDLCAAELRD